MTYEQNIIRFRKNNYHNIKMDCKGGSYLVSADIRAAKGYVTIIWLGSKDFFSICKGGNAIGGGARYV